MRNLLHNTILSSIFLTLGLLVLGLFSVGIVSAVTITNFAVTDSDSFYSSYTGNNVVHLNVTVSNYNSTPGNTVAVVAYFGGLSSCKNSTSTFNLTNIVGTDNWVGSCDVSDDAALVSFKSGNVTVMATESLGPGSPDTKIVNISLYNITVPQGDSCYRFSDASTNFSQEKNFNSMDIILVVQAYGGNSCIPQGFSWGNNWMTVGKIRHTNVNLANPIQAQKILQLINISQIRFNTLNNYQNTRFSIDSNQLLELSTTTLVELYHIPLLSQGIVLSSNDVPAQAITWQNTGFDTMLNTTTYTVSFTVTPGFRNYVVTENIAPRISISSPSVNSYLNNSVTSVAAILNGTGTTISNVFFYINNNSVASYINTLNGANLFNGTNTANCTPGNLLNQSSELLYCNFNINQTDGEYNLTVYVSDFGIGTGNNLTVNIPYIIQFSAPTINVLSPTNSITYYGTNGSMLNIRFNATDGNGVSNCYYQLIGPVNKTGNVSECLNQTTVAIPMYLSSGSYLLNIFAVDSLGKISTSLTSFNVSDTSAPIMIDNTSKPNSTRVTLKILTDESSNCRYAYSDRDYSEMGYLFNDNFTVHTINISLSIGREYPYYVRCIDMSGNYNTASISGTLLYDPNGIANSSNSSDSIKKIDPTKRIELGTLPVGMKIVTVDMWSIPIIDLAVVTTNVNADVSMVFTVLSNPAVNYSENVYKYVRVEHNNLPDSSIDSAKIKFKVEKSWLSSNNVNKNNLTLLRYVTSWVVVPTKMTSEDTNYAYYLADSPGLSLFAISTKSQEIIALESKPVVVQETNMTEVIVEEPQTTGSNTLMWVIISIVIVAMIILGIMIYRNDKARPPIFPQDRGFIGRIKRLFK